VAGSSGRTGRGEQRPRKGEKEFEREKKRKREKEKKKYPKTHSTGTSQRVTAGKKAGRSRYRIISAPSFRCDQLVLPSRTLS
jgi:hypothetical protein